MKFVIHLMASLVAISSLSFGQHKHMQMMEMLKDSVMMDLMMDHIASDNQKRTAMVDKMIYYAIGDTTRMTEMCWKIINDKRMRSLLTNMLDDKKSYKTKKEK